MIPNFPKFKKLEFADKTEFSSHLSQFEPYSDFNFVSVWSYNTLDNVECSVLNHNLVVKMNDYVHLKSFYSFIGKEHTIETVKTLLQFIDNQHLKPQIRLVPESCFKSNMVELKLHFKVIEDADNFDYIYSLEKLLAASGGEYKVLRNMLSKFKRSVETFTLSCVRLDDPSIQSKIVDLVLLWGKAKGKDFHEIQNELMSIKRLLSVASLFDLSCLCLFIDTQLKAFFISEKIDDDYALAHFRKADPTIPGIFQFIDFENAKLLRQLNCQYLNYEQDLGIPSLRRSKQSLQPVKFLKKFLISNKNDDTV